MSILRWIIALPFVVGAVLFALANPQIVELQWTPFNQAMSLPLYFISLFFLGIGFLLGALMAWIGMGKTRQERRQYKRENKQLERDINEANEKLTQALAKQKTTEALPPRIDFDDE
jgi:uncharacterized integral membrane protein